MLAAAKVSAEVTKSLQLQLSNCGSSHSTERVGPVAETNPTNRLCNSPHHKREARCTQGQILQTTRSLLRGETVGSLLTNVAKTTLFDSSEITRYGYLFQYFHAQKEQVDLFTF